MSNLKQLKKQSNVKNLAEKLAKLSDKEESFDDENFWRPTRDKNGNAQCVIRFLPAPVGEDLPFVRFYEHGWQNKDKTSTGFGRWYIEKSLTSIGKDDPVSEFNKKLWDTGLEEKQKWVSANSARRTRFVSNILVIKDPNNPDAEGKVFLFKYGKKIYEKINEALNPTYEGETPVNVFDPWEGNNFKLRVKIKDKFPNYDDSQFDTTSQLAKTDDEIEAIWRQCHPLQDLLDPSTFRTYDELKEHLYFVLGCKVEVETHNDAPSTASVGTVAEPPSTATAESEEEESVESFFSKIQAAE